MSCSWSRTSKLSEAKRAASPDFRVDVACIGGYTQKDESIQLKSMKDDIWMSFIDSRENKKLDQSENVAPSQIGSVVRKSSTSYMMFVFCLMCTQ